MMFVMQKMCEQKLSKEEINKYKRAFAILMLKEKALSLQRNSLTL